MNYSKLVILFFIGLFYSANAQNGSDQIFMSNGETIAVKVLRVEPNTITYTYLGEDLENVVEKDEVIKIIFKSGREQLFSHTMTGRKSISPTFEYPTMKQNEGAILPFEFVFDGAEAPEEGFEAQDYYYHNLMRRPERNTIAYQDVEITLKRLREAGITKANDMRDYEMTEIAKIVGAGILVTGKITVDYRSTTSSTSGSSTTRVNTKKKKVKTYSSDYSTSMDEFDTKVLFKIYNKNGDKIVDVNRVPFMATTRNNYITALNYLMKRTPYYQK
ncbi:hypothetical protein [Zobellia uliginosa]|uniref:hypothetical protein n=1 Tax=Zobellia uliginosa TaxID=143224 RepID=UPI001C0709BF|nr:hypothetical protein [Zobellia uliginosa]MBU2946866.1 hypothetical protein [Zobellia uliginosa]